MTENHQTKRVLTGDRTTGKLHLGHYVGSLQNRVKLQHEMETFVLLADVQALTTHFEKPELIQEHVRQITLDYLSAGIDPDKATIFIQSMIPEIAELTMFFSMFVTVNSLRHNPTIKSEAAERGYTQMNYGFLGYPVSQAADIAFCKASLVPVGEDQIPHIEQTRKIVRRFNELYKPILIEPQALVGSIPRLVGLDGKSKMSKSLGNTIELDATEQEVTEKMMKAVTDPSRIRKDDPGHPEVCAVYSYHQAFHQEQSSAIYEACTAGQMGCVECKRRAGSSLNALLEPMRERRQPYLDNPHRIDEILQAGTSKARAVAKETMREVRDAIGIQYFK